MVANADKLIGVISLSDVVHYLALQQEIGTNEDRALALVRTVPSEVVKQRASKSEE
jgi:hypothetical protein